MTPALAAAVTLVFQSLVCRITHVPGKTGAAVLPCPSCGAFLQLEELFARRSQYFAELDVVKATCVRCEESAEIQIRPSAIYIGYTYAAGTLHFSCEFILVIPNLSGVATAEALCVSLGEKAWKIATAAH